MSSPPRSPGSARAPGSNGASTGVGPVGTAIAAWLVPGAGHLLHGQAGRGAVFFGVLTFMFLIGLAFHGRLFPLQAGDVLVLLAALAEWAIAVPRGLAALFGAGAGEVTAVTYEAGNTFLIASGLLNLLVVFDALELAVGRGDS